MRGKKRDMLTTSLMAMPSSLLPIPGSKDLNEDFLLWLALDMDPLSMVKNNGLNYFFSKNFPYLSIPDESTLWRNHAMKVYHRLVSSVKSELASVASIGLMFQGWTNKTNGTYYIGLRAQFIQDDWIGKVVTLSIKPCTKDVSSIVDHLKNEVIYFIADYANKVLYATHDGTDAMIRASEALQVKSWNCGIEPALHHLLTDDSLGRVANIVSLLCKCKSIFRTLYDELDTLEEYEQNSSDQKVSPEFIESIINMKKLFDAEICYFTNEGYVYNAEADSCNMLAEYDSVKCKEFIGDQCSKRTDSWSEKDILVNWISSLEMINSLLSFQSEVIFTLQLVGKIKPCLQPHEWILVEELSKFLGTFLALNELVSTQTTSLSLIPLIRAEIADSCKVNICNDCAELTEVKNLVLKNLNKRFPVTSSTRLATLLDPATKGLCKSSTEETVELLYNAATEASNSSSLLDPFNLIVTVKPVDDVDLDSKNSESEIGEPISKKMKLVQKHSGACVSWTTPHCNQREEIRKYIKYNDDKFEDDPLAFWKKGQFPILAELAKSILSQSASSAQAEHIFSTAELHLSAKRSCLPSYRATCLSFIRDNYKIHFTSKREHRIKQEPKV